MSNLTPKSAISDDASVGTTDTIEDLSNKVSKFGFDRNSSQNDTELSLSQLDTTYHYNSNDELDDNLMFTVRDPTRLTIEGLNSPRPKVKRVYNQKTPNYSIFHTNISDRRSSLDNGSNLSISNSCFSPNFRNSFPDISSVKNPSTDDSTVNSMEVPDSPVLLHKTVHRHQLHYNSNHVSTKLLVICSGGEHDTGDHHQENSTRTLLLSGSENGCLRREVLRDCIDWFDESKYLMKKASLADLLR